MGQDNRTKKVNNTDKKLDISDVMNSIETEDNTVVIQINGSGYIKEMMEYVISKKITNFQGKYHLFVDGEEISSRDNR